MPCVDTSSNPDIPPEFPTPPAKPAKPPQSQKEDGKKAVELPGWLKLVIVVTPLLALGVSIASLMISFKSFRFATGHARQNEDHDVVAKVLGVSAYTKGFSSTATNGELVVDVALINRGNQNEIIRGAILYYSENTNFNNFASEHFEPKNFQLSKGDRRVLHLATAFNSSNTGKKLWLGVAIRAVAPNADDTQVLWPVCQIELARDANGASWSYNKDQTPTLQIISNVRLPNQTLVGDGLSGF